MSLFLSLGFFLFSLWMSLSLFSWKKDKISKYFIYTFLGIFGFIFSWIFNYLAKASYNLISSVKIFPDFTLINELFYNWLIFLFPLLLLGFLLFSLSYRLQKESSYWEILYFWWMGFFLGFSLYFLLQETNKYSLFEYILLPLLLISLFSSIICSLKSFKNRNFLLKISIIGILSFIFSLSQTFYYSLYFTPLWISIVISIVLGFISLYYIKKDKKG